MIEQVPGVSLAVAQGHPASLVGDVPNVSERNGDPDQKRVSRGCSHDRTEYAAGTGIIAESPELHVSHRAAEGSQRLNVVLTDARSSVERFRYGERAGSCDVLVSDDGVRADGCEVRKSCGYLRIEQRAAPGGRHTTKREKCGGVGAVDVERDGGKREW